MLGPARADLSPAALQYKLIPPQIPKVPTCKLLKKLAGTTRLELATSAVTGRHFHDNSKT
jgi:hypothetical protein